VLRQAAAGMVCALALANAGAAARDDEATALRTSQAAIGHTLGDYTLTAADGRPLRLADLHGRPVLVSLVYTECYYQCSGLTLHLREVVRLARQALGGRSFAVLTVGFDTAHDTPARMLAYGRDRGVGGPDWRLASADAATIRRLAADVGFTWSATPGGFDHVAQVTVVDAGGRVVAQVYGQDFPPPDLVEPLKRLVWGGSATGPSAPGLLERVKLLCTVYDPSTGRYRFDYSMLAGFFPGLLLVAIAVIALLARHRRQ
jgi:protein SCO1